MYLLKPCLLLLKPCFWLSYCPLVWYVSCSTSLWKIENLHKRALRFLPNNYVISYEQLLQKSSKASINLRNHRVLCMARRSEKNNFFTQKIFFLMQHHLVFVDMKSFFVLHQLWFCWHEILFRATSTCFLSKPNYFSCNVKLFISTQNYFSYNTKFLFCASFRMLCHGDIFLLSHSNKNIITF